MSDPLRAYVAVALAVGTVVGAGTVIALEATVFKPAPRVVPDRAAAPVAAEPNDEDAVEAANASLVTSLAECNRRLREAGQRPQPTPPAPVASVMADDGDRASRRGRRERAPLTKEDWERHAEAGTVPYRIPCLRDTPFKPSERDLERLGLTPDDAQAITEAYAASNKRMTDQITPLCASVVGSTDVAQKLGPQACLKALQDSARRADPAKMKESLTHVAEVNAGKREATKGDGSTTEKLFLSLTGEQKAFEDDLAKRLGPEDAARIVASRGLCQERGTASASEDGPPRGSGGGGGGRGRRGAPEN